MQPPTLADTPPYLKEALGTLLDSPHVQGLLLVGSRSRGFQEGAADFDLEVIVDDAFYDTLEPLNRIALVWDGQPYQSRLLGDIYTESRRSMEAKRASLIDVDHWPYEASLLWYDRDGEIAPLVAALAHFPDAIWEPRLQVHHVDFWYHVGRARKIAAYESRLNLALVLSRAIHAYIKCVFVLNRRWPPLVHWGQQALERSALPLRPAEDTALLTEALTTLDPAPLKQLDDALTPLLDQAGISWHAPRMEEFITALGPTFAHAREQWSRY